MYLNIVTHSAHDWMRTVTNIKTVDASHVSFGSLEEMQEDSYTGFEFYDCRPIQQGPNTETEKLFNFPESFVRLEISRENGDFNVVYTNYGAFLCNEVGDTVQRYLVR